MKITAALLTLLALFLPHALAQEHTRWNLPEGAVARLGKGSIRAVQYSPDGTLFAAAGTAGIWLYDGTTHQVENSSDSSESSPIDRGRLERDRNGEVALLTDHTEGVVSVSFSPDGSTLASASDDRKVRLWDVETGALKQTLTGDMDWGHDWITSVAFSPDGRTLAGGSASKTVRLWDTITGDQIRELTGHTSWATSVSFSADGRTLASGSWDGTMLLWKVTD